MPGGCTSSPCRPIRRRSRPSSSAPSSAGACPWCWPKSRRPAARCRRTWWTSFARRWRAATPPRASCGCGATGAGSTVWSRCPATAAPSGRARPRPRCGGRRMAQGAANWVEGLFPEVPVRQWVLSLPMDQRLALAWRPKLVSAALAILIEHVGAYYRRRVGGHPGSVTVIQRFGSTLNLNVHFHVLFADGSWSTAADGGLQFRSTSPPTLTDVSAVVEAVASDLALLIPAGHAEEQEPDDAQQVLELASLMNRAAFGPSWSQGASRKRGERRPRRHGAGLEASSGWTSLHAGVRVAAKDRDGLEKICRYVLGPVGRTCGGAVPAVLAAGRPRVAEAAARVGRRDGGGGVQRVRVRGATGRAGAAEGAALDPIPWGLRAGVEAALGDRARASSSRGRARGVRGPPAAALDRMG